jgi:hypothetical protein
MDAGDISPLMALVRRQSVAVRPASNYIMRHDPISSNVADGSIGEDADRLRAAQEALAGFCVAVEHSKPNSGACLVVPPSEAVAQREGVRHAVRNLR